MRYIAIYILCVIMLSCNSGNNSNALAVDLTGYEISNYDGISKAIKKDANGAILEEGYISNGTKNGAWMIYDPQNGRIKSLASYTNGNLNGPSLEYSNRGQIETRIDYVNNVYDGKYVTYKNGRPVKEMNYDNGVITGTLKEYDNRGKVQKSTNFKDGKMHGDMFFYNEDEEVIMQYKYENGEKLSGGMLEKEPIDDE